MLTVMTSKLMVERFVVTFVCYFVGWIGTKMSRNAGLRIERKGEVIGPLRFVSTQQTNGWIQYHAQ